MLEAASWYFLTMQHYRLYVKTDTSIAIPPVHSLYAQNTELTILGGASQRAGIVRPPGAQHSALIANDR